MRLKVKILKDNQKLSKKQQRTYSILFGLLENYIKSGKPVGSNTLKETEFQDLSSATIRNYFSQLEKEDYLSQLHTSGGRIPTEKAYRFYAENFLDSPIIDSSMEKWTKSLGEMITPEITEYLQTSAEQLSLVTKTAVFLSAPRFDHDFISSIKLVELNLNRCLGVMITNFGVIKTEVLHSEISLNESLLKKIELYFQFRLQKQQTPPPLSSEEESLAQQFYNEIMVRYIVGYTYFNDEDIFRTGFSQLLTYPELNEPDALANSLALFENVHSMRLLLRDATKKDHLRTWIGEELATFTKQDPHSSVITVPYHINNKAVGAIAILGPLRLPYRHLFGTLSLFSEQISHALTQNLYKYKVSYRSPSVTPAAIKDDEKKNIKHKKTILIENKKNNN